jgi:hypothetical protein
MLRELFWSREQLQEHNKGEESSIYHSSVCPDVCQQKALHSNYSFCSVYTLPRFINHSSEKHSFFPFWFQRLIIHSEIFSLILLLNVTATGEKKLICRLDCVCNNKRREAGVKINVLHRWS